MSVMPDSAMVMAAGKGTRMGALSQVKPKPLVDVLGISLLDRILNHLQEASVKKAVVNVHHLADQIEERLADRVTGPEIIISDERALLLGQGGGIKKALGSLLSKDAVGAEMSLESKPFFAINGDALWVNEGENILHKLARVFDPRKMDILLMLVPVTEALGYDGTGDFCMKPDGSLGWYRAQKEKAYVFAGVQILIPSLFLDMPEGFWSLRELYDRAEKAGRLYGCLLEGHWMHVGTTKAITQAEEKLMMLEKS